MKMSDDKRRNRDEEKYGYIPDRDGGVRGGYIPERGDAGPPPTGGSGAGGKNDEDD
jgi:hypothetical protein